MPEAKSNQNPATLNLTTEDLQAILSKVLEESKKPYVDPEIERRKQRDRERLRAEHETLQKLRAEREAACPHLRSDNTSAIAWMQNSDGIWRGVCQRCHTLFTPTHKQYHNLIRIPTRATVDVG